jgi:hypothetical protein
VAIYVIDLFRENSTYSRIAAPDEHGHPALLGRSSHVCAMRAIDLVAMFHVEPRRVGRDRRLPAMTCRLRYRIPRGTGRSLRSGSRRETGHTTTLDLQTGVMRVRAEVRDNRIQPDSHQGDARG